MRISLNITKYVVSAMAALALVLTASVQQSRAVSVSPQPGPPSYGANTPSITGGTFSNTSPSPQSQGDAGFTVAGDFSFRATASDVTITYQVDRIISVSNFPSGNFALTAGIKGDFETSAVGVFLTQYTTDNTVNTVVGSNRIEVSGSEVIVAASPAPLIPNFDLSASATGTSSPFFLDTTQLIDLRQQATISFSGLQNGDVVSVQFPNDTDLAPSPEPATLTLAGLSAVGLLGCGWLRRRKAAAVGVGGA